MGEGENVQTVLTSLYKIGAVTLPHGANAFAKAAAELHKTGETQTNAFASFGNGEGIAELAEAFSSLRNIMQDEVLVATCNNLNKAGEALVQIASDYSEVDNQAAEDLENVQAYLESDQPPDALKPPDKVDPPSSDDPH